MIYFTAGGDIFNAFHNKYDCENLSIRKKGIECITTHLKDGDVLIHNAANLANTDLNVLVDDNLLLTKTILDKVSKSGKAIKFIYLSSMSILGKNADYKDVKDMSNYAYSKYLAETYCLKNKYPTTCVRFSTLFYNNPEKDGLSKLVYNTRRNKEINLINNGQDSRDFIPLLIAVSYLHKISKLCKTNPVYNIASGNSTSFKEIANILQNIEPQLKISNKNQPYSAQFVLSDFNKEDILELGEIPYQLHEQIKLYFDSI